MNTLVCQTVFELISSSFPNWTSPEKKKMKQTRGLLSLLESR